MPTHRKASGERAKLLPLSRDIFEVRFGGNGGKARHSHRRRIAKRFGAFVAVDQVDFMLKKTRRWALLVQTALAK